MGRVTDVLLCLRHRRVVGLGSCKRTFKVGKIRPSSTHAFKRKRFRNNRHTVKLRISLQSPF
jgi:hypothetical protein